jgi:hypothetical protein
MNRMCKKRPDFSTEAIRLRHADLERDAAITNHFTGLNALPIIVTFTQIEDLVKTIQGIEAGFAAMRITGVDDLDDSAVYEQILSEMSLPAVSTAYDEIPFSCSRRYFTCSTGTISHSPMPRRES